MEVYIGADYKGFDKKASAIQFLTNAGVNVVDVGAYEKNEGDDFNGPAVTVALAVRKNPSARGVLICDSAHGVTMQANRFKGVRAANCSSVESAKLAREHDDANILCMSAHFLGDDEIRKIVQVFLTTNFEPLERRLRRIKKLDERNDYD